MHTHTAIRVRVFHADPVISAGLKTVLQGRFNVELHLAAVSRPTDVSGVDVIVADYPNGIDCVRSLSNPKVEQRLRPAKVLIVSDINREREIRLAISAGVRGYVLQGCPIDELVNGVISVGQGQRYLSQSVARRIADGMSHDELTNREAEVLHLLTAGSSNKSIARELGIAEGTVKVHVKGILEKLGVASRTHAVAVAGELGLVGRLRTMSDGVEQVGVRNLMVSPAAARSISAIHV